MPASENIAKSTVEEVAAVGTEVADPSTMNSALSQTEHSGIQ
jgi:hypothetical protein